MRLRARVHRTREVPFDLILLKVEVVEFSIVVFISCTVNALHV